MSRSWVPLGELLVAANILTQADLDNVLERQKGDGRRLGTLLIESGLVTETQVVQILSQQLSIPWVSLYHVSFTRELLALVPRAFAERFVLIPIFLRRVRGLGQELYVAMDDPTDSAALEELQNWSGLSVRAMVAPPSEIRSAIRVYYSGSESQPPKALAEALAELGAVAGQAVDLGSGKRKQDA